MMSFQLLMFFSFNSEDVETKVIDLMVKRVY